MTLKHSGVGDAGELGLMQLLDVGSSAISHTRAKSTDQLIDNLLNSSLVGHTSGDSLWHELLHVLCVALEIAVLRAVLLLHGLERTHTAVALKLTSVEDDGLTRALLCTGNKRTDHHRTTTGSQCLDDVARIAQSTVGNQWNTCTLERAIYIIYGTQLGNTHTCNHTGGTDRTRTDTHLDGVGTIVN